MANLEDSSRQQVQQSEKPVSEHIHVRGFSNTIVIDRGREMFFLIQQTLIDVSNILSATPLYTVFTILLWHFCYIVFNITRQHSL